MFYFSGVFFPLDAFPRVIQIISWFVPLTPLVNLTRAFTEGHFGMGDLLSFGIILVLSVVLFLLSLVRMRRRITP
jgi:lipooligosaccharide transport system permease protein